MLVGSHRADAGEPATEGHALAEPAGQGAHDEHRQGLHHTAPAGEREVGLPVAPVVARWRCAGSGYAWSERFAVPSVPALSGEAGRVSGGRPGGARLGGGPGVDRGKSGHTDRPEVPRLLQRLGCDAADAPAWLQSPGPGTAGRRARRAGRHRLEGGDLERGKGARAACGGYVCFEDEAGFTRRPPQGRTWGRRGHTPVVTVSGRSGRRLVAGLIALRPGSRTRRCHRLRTHPGGRGKHRSMGERADRRRPPPRQGAHRADLGPPEHPRLPRHTPTDRRTCVAHGVPAA